MNIENKQLNEEQFVNLLIMKDEFEKNLAKIKQNQEFYESFDDYDNVDRENVENLINYINFLQPQIIALTDTRINEMNTIIKMNKRRFKYLYDNYNSEQNNDESTVSEEKDAEENKETE